MEMASGNSQIGSSAAAGGRRSFCTIGGDAMEIKCIKRRRRDSSLSALRSNNERELGHQLKGDQTAATATATATAAAATTVKRSSRFRGVSRHRWTGRYEAHLWDKGSWNPTQRKKGKQVYLGAYDEEESAARAYDLAALKYWGTSTFTNFPVSEYEKEIEIMKNVSKEEYLASLRRRSSGFSRGVSKYRGVARHHHNGRWEARIGRVFGNKYLYLGTYSTQEEAAHAYDIAAIEYRGINAVTNFDLSTYIRWLRPGAHSSAPSPATQDSKSTADPPQPQPTFINSGEKTAQQQLDLLRSNNPYVVEDLNRPLKQEIFQTNAAVSPCFKSTSSPTALSLLLKSSMFKELVEKNLNAHEDEEDEAKLVPEMGNYNGVRDVFYDGIRHIPYYEVGLPGLVFKENTWPFYNRTG